MPTIKQSLILILALCAGLYGTDTFAALACQVPGNPGNNFLDGSGSGDSPQVCNAAPAAVETELPSEAVGNPINVVTGNKYQADVDLRALPGLLGLEITRHYNSQTNYHGWFGYGWSFSYETFLQASVDAKALHLRQADGRRIGFVLNSKNNRYLTQLPSDGYVVKTKIGYEWSWPQGRKLRFNEKGFLQAIIESGGEMVTLSYDLRNRLNQIRDPQGRTIRFLQDAKGHIIEAQTPVGTYKYNYDRIGNLVAVFDPSGKPRRYSYEDRNNSHLLTAITNRLGITYARFGYDRDGKANFSTHSDGVEKVSIRYENDKSVLINSKGGETVYRYKVIGDLPVLTEVSGVGCSTCGPTNVRYQYNRSGQLTAEAKAGITTLFEYDLLGRLASKSRQSENRTTQLLVRYRYENESTVPVLIEHPSVLAGKFAQTRLSYTPAGKIQEIVEIGYRPDGKVLHRTTRYQYDGQSRLVAADGPLPGNLDTTFFDYDTSDRLVRAKLPGGQAIEILAYDEAGRPLKIRGLDRVVIDYGYAPSGDVNRIVRAGLVSQFDLDAEGNLIKSTSPDGRSEKRTYDVANRLLAIVDPEGNTKHYQYDTENKLIAQWTSDTQNQVLFAGNGYRYNESGRLQEITGTGEVYVSQKYDRLGRLIETAKRGELPIAYRYDEFSRPTAWIRGGKVVDEYQYDQFDRLIELKAANGAKFRRELDDFGRVVKIVSADAGEQSAEYDEEDRQLLYVDSSGKTIRSQYDPAGRLRYREYLQGQAREKVEFTYQGFYLVSVTSPNHKTTYAYDNAGRVSQVIEQLDQVRFVTKYEYGSDGQLASKTLPGGEKIAYTWRQGKIAGFSIDGKPGIQEASYLPFDGRLLNYKLGNGLATNLTYGLGGKLQGIQTDGIQSTAFGFDDAGNLASITDGRRREIYAYDAAHRLTQATIGDVVERFTYDGNGNRLSRQLGGQIDQYQYAANSNRLASIARGDAANDFQYSPDGLLYQSGQSEYRYTRDGRLAEIRSGGRLVATYAYNSLGERTRKTVYEGNQSKTTYFLYEDQRLIAEANEAGKVTASYVYLAGRPVLKREHGQNYYLSVDQRSAPVAVTDENKAVRWWATYSAFGFGEVSGESSSNQGNFSLNLRLAGQYFDAESGLHYNYQRYYQPAFGRYLTSDLLGVAAGSNTYAYVDNSPLNRTDPVGLTAEPDDPDLSNPSFNPTRFGTLVHTAFNMQLTSFGDGWGGGDSRNGTWPTKKGGLLPDGYYVNENNLTLEGNNKPFVGDLWELKPIGWMHDPVNYAKAQVQIDGYVSGALKGCWKKGSSLLLKEKLKPFEMIFASKVYTVRFVQDKKDNSGLIFYAKQANKERTQPVVVPAPAAEKQTKLKQRLQEVGSALSAIGWSALQVIGMLALIAAAILAMLAVAIVMIAALEAVLASLALLASFLASGGGILAFIAAVFGLAATPAQAQVEGQKKQDGLLNRTLSWIKGLF